MIDSAISAMLLENKEHFLIPASQVATVQEDNSLMHAFLVLNKVRYSRIPVLRGDDELVGMLSMPMITNEMLGMEQLDTDVLDKKCVRDVMDTHVPAVDNPYNVEEVLHLLVDNPFLPVVADHNEFTGIVTRKEWMKSFNFLVHNIDRQYTLTPIERTAHATH